MGTYFNTKLWVTCILYFFLYDVVQKQWPTVILIADLVNWQVNIPPTKWIPRPSFKFERLLIGYKSKFKDRL